MATTVPSSRGPNLNMVYCQPWVPGERATFCADLFLSCSEAAAVEGRGSLRLVQATRLRCRGRPLLHRRRSRA